MHRFLRKIFGKSIFGDYIFSKDNSTIIDFVGFSLNPYSGVLFVLSPDESSYGDFISRIFKGNFLNERLPYILFNHVMKYNRKINLKPYDQNISDDLRRFN